MQAIAEIGAHPVVPKRSSNASQRPFDRVLYKDRNAIERVFNKIKNFRSIATRYDKRARNSLGFTNLVCAIKWCK